MCHSGTRPCRHSFGSMMCMAVEFWCDGQKDCKDNVDEINCTKCNKFRWQCKDTFKLQCIKPKWRCDGDKNCYDGSDELNCTNTETSQPPKTIPTTATTTTQPSTARTTQTSTTNPTTTTKTSTFNPKTRVPTTSPSTQPTSTTPIKTQITTTTTESVVSTRAIQTISELATILTSSIKPATQSNTIFGTPKDLLLLSLGALCVVLIVSVIIGIVRGFRRGNQSDRFARLSVPIPRIRNDEASPLSPMLLMAGGFEQNSPDYSSINDHYDNIYEELDDLIPNGPQTSDCKSRYSTAYLCPVETRKGISGDHPSNTDMGYEIPIQSNDTPCFISRGSKEKLSLESIEINQGVFNKDTIPTGSRHKSEKRDSKLRDQESIHIDQYDQCIFEHELHDTKIVDKTSDNSTFLTQSDSLEQTPKKGRHIGEKRDSKLVDQESIHIDQSDQCTFEHELHENKSVDKTSDKSFFLTSNDSSEQTSINDDYLTCVSRCRPGSIFEHQLFENKTVDKTSGTSTCILPTSSDSSGPISMENDYLTCVSSGRFGPMLNNDAYVQCASNEDQLLKPNKNEYLTCIRTASDKGQVAVKISDVCTLDKTRGPKRTQRDYLTCIESEIKSSEYLACTLDDTSSSNGKRYESTTRSSGSSTQSSVESINSINMIKTDIDYSDSKKSERRVKMNRQNEYDVLNRTLVNEHDYNY